MKNQVRLLRDKELEEAAIIYTNVFSGSPWNEPWSRNTAYARLYDISKTPGYIGIGYFHSENNKLIGFIVGNEEQWANYKTFYLNEICVLTSIQQTGVGTSLLTFLKELLVQRKVKEAYVSTERGQGKPARFLKRRVLSSINPVY
ncbi:MULTISPECIES: GNAT family N-acetyltransferase [Priestia]|uniref:Acetyltransferase, GNAT family n=6 Tax=Priestia TaxID=2800373 RepID=D5DUC0_PRIM1|nr:MULTISPECIES: GNAT family N-acetyltransferase [Priestia]MDH6654233.1 GNAT superfamily N-acetyltransferase [Bacillus sp. PvP124]MDP9575648.1 GNAT superfamily N-acetyltransferase [Bacillus sp. 1751]ADE69782.1 acetyltransferase, GNAT family [Priestia megaterium QM B1551]MCA4153569.1 GNAT family N-acetyltransferase [Priestia megaterium]MDD9785985.1 GNAT family N-acetyltransferase [Priestia megaterium]